MKKTIYSSLICLALVSCGKKENTKEIIVYQPENKSTSTIEQQDRTQTIEKEDVIFHVKRVTEIAPDLSNISQFITDMNRYSITAELKNLKSFDSILSCKEVDANKANPALTTFIDSETFTGNLKFQLEKDAANTTIVNCKVEDSDNEVLGEAKIKLKKDMLIGPGIIHAKNMGIVDGKNEFGALVISAHTKLVTDGMNLKIQATEFIALENSKIESFEEKDLKSPDNTLGKSGGVININANKSFGKLSVTMRGKNGGDNTTVDRSYEQFTTASINRCPTYNEGEHFTDELGGNYTLPRGSITFAFNTKGAKGINGGDSGSFYLNALDGNMEVEIVKVAGLGGRGGFTSNPAPSITIQFFKPEKHPWYTLGFNPNYVHLYKGTDYSSHCGAVVRYYKSPSLQNMAQGENGEAGKETPSCYYVKETNEYQCI